MKALFILGVTSLLIGFTGCATHSPDQRKLDGQLRNKQAPDFELTALDGQKVKLSDYRGKPVILAFWATGCPPCRAEAPHLSHLAAKYKSDGLVVLAVNAWDEEKDVLARFAAENKLQQRILLNGRDVAKNAYGQKAIPVLIWIDRSGKIVRTHLDFAEGDANPMDEFTAKLVAGKI